MRGSCVIRPTMAGGSGDCGKAWAGDVFKAVTPFDLRFPASRTTFFSPTWFPAPPKTVNGDRVGMYTAKEFPP